MDNDTIVRTRRPIRSRRATLEGIALIEDLSNLLLSLNTIDRDDHPYEYFGTSPDSATADRRAAIAALTVVQDFLRDQGIISAVLFNLKLELKAVERAGETRPLFTPASTRPGRKPDDIIVQILKGWIAGLTYVRMLFGEPREQAAKWMARQIPEALSRRVSSKPIIASTVKEWMYQSGCTLQIRRELRLKSVQNNFHTYFAKNIKSKRIEGRPDQRKCLSIICSGYEYLDTKKPFPFEMYFHFLSDESNLDVLIDLL
jgi:hypothetical protein